MCHASKLEIPSKLEIQCKFSLTLLRMEGGGGGGAGGGGGGYLAGKIC